MANNIDILFLNLPYEFNISRASRWPEKTKSGTLYYPYWLAYCVGVCEDKNLKCKLVDCITRAYTLQDTLNEIRKTNPEYIMCELTTPTVAYDYNTITAIKNEFPNVKIIVGGTHATILPEQVLKECEAIDFIVRQEYDFTVPELVRTEHIDKTFASGCRVLRVFIDVFSGFRKLFLPEIRMFCFREGFVVEKPVVFSFQHLVRTAIAEGRFDGVRKPDQEVSSEEPVVEVAFDLGKAGGSIVEMEAFREDFECSVFPTVVLVGIHLEHRENGKKQE